MLNSLNWLIFLLFTTILFIVPHRPLMDGDTGWHIMAGYEILKNSSIPQFNVFSYTAGNYQWLNMSWLWDVVMACVDRIGGLYLVSALTIIIGGIVIALLTWFCQKRGAGAIATTSAMTLGILAFMPGLVARPHQFTYLFTLLFMMVIYFYDKEPVKKRSLYALPLIMLFWVNIHGGFLAGFSIIGAYFLQFIFEKRWAEAKSTFICGVVTLVTVFANPLGFGIIDAAMRTLSGPLRSFITEWQHPDETHYFIYFTAFAIIFLSTLKHHSLAEKVICFFWCLQGIEAIRNVPIFVIVSAPVMASGLQLLVKKKAHLVAKDQNFTADLSKPSVHKISRAFAIILPVFFLLPLWPELIGFYPIKSPHYPKAEIDYIISHNPKAVVLNDYNYGGYMLYESHGTLKTFIDGRAETAFPLAVINDYLKFYDHAENWEALLDKHHIDTVILPKEKADYFNGNKAWLESFKGEQAVVFTRKE